MSFPLILRISNYRLHQRRAQAAQRLNSAAVDRSEATESGRLQCLVLSLVGRLLLLFEGVNELLHVFRAA
jgi:hypothetical protein